MAIPKKRARRKKPTDNMVKDKSNGATKSKGRPPVTKELPPDLIFNMYQLADLLGVGAPKFRDLIANEILLRSGHGKYRVFENVKRYINSIVVARRDSSPTRSKEVESTRLTSAKADREELLFQELEGSLVRVTDVQLAWEKLLIALRQALLSLPSQIDYLLRESEKTERATIVEDALRKALEVLSDEPEYLARRDKRRERFENPEAIGESVSPEG